MNILLFFVDYIFGCIKVSYYAPNQNDPYNRLAYCIFETTVSYFIWPSLYYLENGDSLQKVKLVGFVAFFHLTEEKFLHTAAPMRWDPSHRLAARATWPGGIKCEILPPSDHTEYCIG